MEVNSCDINHLDSDVLLPPRKRLLAGLKKQSSSDIDVAHRPASTDSSSSSSSEFNVRLNNLLSSHSNNPNLSQEELVEASRSAAIAAYRAARAARSVAEEKAAIAAKAVAAAKNALELVASMSEEASGREMGLKKSKLKKHVPVQLLYKKHRPVENFRKDEEMARKLHRAINSSPRISKNSSSPESRNHKHKKLKCYLLDKSGVSNGSVTLEGKPPSSNNGHIAAGEADSEGSIEEVYMIRGDAAMKFDTGDQSKMDNGEAKASQSKEGKWSDNMSLSAKKRGRVKLKKLPLSICNFRDQSNSKEVITRSSALAEKMIDKPNASKIRLLPMEPSADGVMAVEATPTWKCQEFNTPACVKQTKIMQS